MMVMMVFRGCSRDGTVFIVLLVPKSGDVEGWDSVVVSVSELTFLCLVLPNCR